MRTKNFTMMVVALVLSAFTLKAQTSCPDFNGYVNAKNVGATGFVTLVSSQEEMAAQTYHYSGPGKVSRVRVYGNSLLPVVPLRISVYAVDANGRPTATLLSVDRMWYSWVHNTPGFIEVGLGVGVNVSSDFAVGVSILGPVPTAFQVKYTGNGESKGEDLASLAGTSTGGNWASAKTAFAKDGDFYLVPEVTSFINAGFTIPSQCIATGTSVAFNSTTAMTKDSMFNLIGSSQYTGSNTYYSWNFGDGSPLSTQTNPTHTYATAGVYTVTLTAKIEGWGGVCSATFSRTISVGLTAGSTSIVNVLCNGGNTGAVTVTGTGGSTPYTYSINGTNFQSGAQFINLPAGSYNVYVKDAAGCTSVASANITQPAPLVFATPQTTNAKCDSTDGQILVSASGGNGAKQYRLNQGPFTSSGLFSNLRAGAYQITVRDAVSCTKTITVVVSNQSAPAIAVLNSTNVSCAGGNDGSISLGATGGGTGTLQYSINGGNTFQAGASFTGLSAGSYAVIVKDATGCSSGTTVNITQPSPITFSTSTVPVSCNGGNNGQIIVNNAVGGIGKLSFSVNGTTYQSGTTFSGLSSGSYTVYVKDIANCSASAQATVTQPTLLAGSATVTNPTCNGSTNGVISVTGSGGAGGYTYSLDGINYQLYGFFANLGAGNYTVHVKDQNGCMKEFYEAVNEPSLVTGNIQTTNSTCGNSNGAILVTAAGGSGSGYQYSIDGTNFGPSGSFANKASGSYYIVIRDGAGCQRVVSANITDANGPNISSATYTNVSCNGGEDGSISVLSVTGGTGTLLYGLNGSGFQQQSNFIGLQAGTYQVIVKDANGCVGDTTFTVTQPAPINVTPTVTNATCFGVNNGKVTVTAIGGAGTLAYSIGGSSTFQSSNVFNNLYAGTYAVVVRDAAGCIGTSVAQITEPTEISILTEVLNVTCAGAGNGSISAYALGGTGTAQYSINGTAYQSSGTFSGLSGGAYVIYVKDANQCLKVKSVLVLEPSELDLSTIVSDVTCAGGNNGFVNLSVDGGVSPYKYKWSNGTSNEDLFNLSAGTYTVTLTDANGCSAIKTESVDQPALPIIINGTVTPSTANNGAVDVTVTGGTPPYLFSWSNGATTEDLTNVSGGTYTVEVTDTKGCASSNVFTVSGATGIEDVNALSSNFEVYPNPASQSVNVKMNGAEVQQLKVFDVLGRVVFETATQFSDIIINTSDFHAGAYYIQAVVDGNTITKQLKVVR